MRNACPASKRLWSQPFQTPAQSRGSFLKEIFVTDFIPAFIKGFLLMASLIFAVGPQNAMLIRQGLRREHPFLIAAIFTLCDCLLIALGVFGIGQFIAQIVWLRSIVVYGGAAFLFWFAGKSFLTAWKGGQSLLSTEPAQRGSLIVTAFAVSLINPGALIDTLVVIGSVSSQYAFSEALAFGFGAQLFSLGFFFLLAGFTHKFAPALNNPTVWRVIDILIGLVTLWIGIHLLFIEF